MNYIKYLAVIMATMCMVNGSTSGGGGGLSGASPSTGSAAAPAWPIESTDEKVHINYILEHILQDGSKEDAQKIEEIYNYCGNIKDRAIRQTVFMLFYNRLDPLGLTQEGKTVEQDLYYNRLPVIEVNQVAERLAGQIDRLYKDFKRAKSASAYRVYRSNPLRIYRNLKKVLSVKEVHMSEIQNCWDCFRGTASRSGVDDDYDCNLKMFKLLLKYSNLETTLMAKLDDTKQDNALGSIVEILIHRQYDNEVTKLNQALARFLNQPGNLEKLNNELDELVKTFDQYKSYIGIA